MRDKCIFRGSFVIMEFGFLLVVRLTPSCHCIWVLYGWLLIANAPKPSMECIIISVHICATRFREVVGWGRDDGYQLHHQRGLQPSTVKRDILHCTFPSTYINRILLANGFETTIGLLLTLCLPLTPTISFTQITPDFGGTHILPLTPPALVDADMSTSRGWFVCGCNLDELLPLSAAVMAFRLRNRPFTYASISLGNAEQKHTHALSHMIWWLFVALRMQNTHELKLSDAHNAV